MTERKYGKKSDTVAIYHIHRKEWNKNYIIQKLKV